MKKGIKWIFIIIIVVILAIDIAGFWKYKLKGTNYVTSTNADASDVSDVTEEDVEPEIEYAELSSASFENDEKLFITNIELDDTEEETYTIKGLLYEQYEITKEEYDNIKSGKTKIEIFGNEYSKDKLQSNNLKLKSENTDAEDFYISYNSKTKKYTLKDANSDSIVYKPTEKYLKTTVSGDLAFSIEKGGKTTKKTVADVADLYNNVEVKTDTSKVNLSSFTFNKKGICTKIAELDV